MPALKCTPPAAANLLFFLTAARINRSQVCASGSLSQRGFQALRRERNLA
jgi:hypothetical protein